MIGFNILKQSIRHLNLPHNILRTRAIPVDFATISPDSLRAVVEGMFYALYASDGGVGLAAPMLGVNMRIATIDSQEGQPLVLLNPEILETSDEQEDGPEANLCLPEIAANVKRPKHIRYRAHDQSGRLIEAEAHDLLARIILHELDVLDGKMFFDFADKVRVMAPEVRAERSLARLYEGHEGADTGVEDKIPQSMMRYLSTATLFEDTFNLKSSVLRKKCAPINFEEWDPEQLRALIGDMIWLQHQLEGVGIAAPQVGLSLQLSVIDDRQDPPLVLINPEILEKSPETELGREGCLSLPFYWGEVERSKSVTIRALNVHGETFTLRADDFLARIIQHEVDHLNGVLFVDHFQSPDALQRTHPGLLTQYTADQLYQEQQQLENDVQKL